jgi:hypothetical protein
LISNCRVTIRIPRVEKLVQRVPGDNTKGL